MEGLDYKEAAVRLGISEDALRGRLSRARERSRSTARAVSHLPVLVQLQRKFEPQGVFFLTVHGPGEDEKQVRKILEFKKTPLVRAMDLDRQASSWKHIGATAWRYVLQSFPFVVGIDNDLARQIQRLLDRDD